MSSVKSNIREILGRHLGRKIKVKGVFVRCYNDPGKVYKKVTFINLSMDDKYIADHMHVYLHKDELKNMKTMNEYTFVGEVKAYKHWAPVDNIKVLTKNYTLKNIKKIEEVVA